MERAAESIQVCETATFVCEQEHHKYTRVVHVFKRACVRQLLSNEPLSLHLSCFQRDEKGAQPKSAKS